MFKQVKLFGLVFFGLVIAIAMGLVATRPAAAAPVGSVVAQACELPPSIDGSADPSTVMPGQSIRFTVFNFRAGEGVSFWFTTPRGSVFGTAEPLCCVPPDGFLRFAPVQIPPEFGQEPGRWAFTVQGRDSGHTSVVYFCVSNTAVQPTATAAPPTATAVPATATSVPATATTAATTQPTAPVATAEVTTTAVATTQPTAEVTVQPTSPPAATVEATVEATVSPVPEATAMATPIVVGMPGTGAPGEPFSMATLALIMLSITLLAAGLAILQRKTSSQ